MSNHHAADDQAQKLQVDNGLFRTQSIVGSDFVAIPKGFIAEELQTCVFRKDHVAAVAKQLEEMVRRGKNAPGVYLQGPAGVGKSVIVYTVTQLAKFHWGWLTVYVPHCKEWLVEDCKAKGFFLDRVWEAFSVEVFREKFPVIWKELNDPIEANGSEDWESMSKKQKDKVEDVYEEVMQFLKKGTGETPVLLVFDEVIALDADIRKREPWNVTDFDGQFLHHGALLVSGTTDSEFLGSMATGVRQTNNCVYDVTELKPEETELLLNTQVGNPLKRIRDFDQDLWHEIADASGNMPRDLAGFATTLKDLSARIDGATGDEPARKKIKLDIHNTIQKHRRVVRKSHRQMFENVLKKRDSSQGHDTFRSHLIQWCRAYFLENCLEGEWEILRAANFIVQDSQMRPTTIDAAQAYFEWFMNVYAEEGSSSVVASLTTLGNPEANGSQRGHAFENLVATKLTVCGSKHGFRLSYRLLQEKQVRSLGLNVKTRLFSKANSPPHDFRTYPPSTLLTHTDRNGGEARVDMIHYGINDVVYMEATVGNYRTTKLPSGEKEEDRIQLILGAVQKWLGSKVYDVKISPDSSELSVTYKQTYASRANAERQPPPQVHYIVVTTCPSSVQPLREWAKKYRWIKVCFLEDLVESGIVPRESVASILRTQSIDAIGTGMLEDESCGSWLEWMLGLTGRGSVGSLFWNGA